MFSWMSVNGQPSPPAIANGGTPDAFSVPASLSSAVHVLGGVMPAFLKALTLYQMVDLLAPLKTIPYSFLLTVPSVIHEGA